MIAFKLIIYFLSVLIPGYLLALLFFKKEKISILLLSALSYGLGSFFISIQLFLYFFILRLPFSAWFYFIIFLEIITLLFLVLKRRGLNIFLNFNFKFYKKIKTKEVIIIFLILIQVLFVFSHALARPNIIYDSIGIWLLKAKILFTENIINFNEQSPIYLGGGFHRNYPWHIPLLSYWMFLILGEFNDLLVNLIFVFYFISLLIVCYCFIKRYISKFKALVFTFFLSSMPLVFYHSFNAYADLTLSFYVLLSFVFLYEWLEKQEKKYLAFSGVFAGISFFIKNEAIIYIIASLAVTTLYILINKNWQRIKYLFYYIIFVALPVLPWLIFKIQYNLGIKNVKEGLGFHPEILGRFFHTMFTSNCWNIWWFIVVVVLIINFKKIINDKPLLLGWTFLFLSFVGFLILYLFTEEFRFAMNSTANARNILTFIPISVFITAVSLRSHKSHNMKHEINNI